MRSTAWRGEIILRCKASVGRQSPRVVLYRTQNLCSLENVLQSGGAGSMGSAGHRFNLADILSHNYQPQEEEETPEADKSFEDLERESDVPFEELLALYGYEASDPISEHESEGSSPSELADNLPDMTLDKEQIAKDLLSGEEEEETQSSADDLTPSVTSHDASDLFPHPLRSNSIEDDKELSLSDEDSEEDDSILSNDCKKEIMVGPQYQAPIPPFIGRYRQNEKASPTLPQLSPSDLCRCWHCDKVYDNEDQLLWDPYVLPERQVEEFLYKAVKRARDEKMNESIPEGIIIKDSEQALYELVKCNFNAEEALRRLRFNVKVVQDELCAWSEEECRNFEHGLRVHGKNFHLIQANKVRTRSVGECVAYYYMWKKSERYDYFAQQTKFGKKKYSLHAGVLDYMDQELDSFEGESCSRPPNSPPISSTTSRLDSEQDPLVLQNSEQDVEIAVCTMSGNSQMFEYCSPPVNRSETSCSLDPICGQVGVSPTHDCDTVTLSQAESGFFQLELDQVILDRPALEMSTKKLKMDFSLPKTLSAGLPDNPGSVDFENHTSHIAQAKMSVAVTDFGSIDVGDVNSLLSAHTLHHPATLHSESLSQ
ncbi:mesoderm induction early response protein 2-like isoform X2 [Scyliorhinus canicula]|uniref:mesoderm induction early response protein 2-like isoform X2 n=1 Tax=Scyliorhinus canicula TaxID=7830 RepID=UPI0018F49624|nr:mesoderm induction early response protein 2-like isoform X2 [Scyliorhinus canicula]